MTFEFSEVNHVNVMRDSVTAERAKAGAQVLIYNMLGMLKEYYLIFFCSLLFFQAHYN